MASIPLPGFIALHLPVFLRQLNVLPAVALFYKTYTVSIFTFVCSLKMYAQQWLVAVHISELHADLCPTDMVSGVNNESPQEMNIRCVKWKYKWMQKNAEWATRIWLIAEALLQRSLSSELIRMIFWWWECSSERNYEQQWVEYCSEWPCTLICSDNMLCQIKTAYRNRSVKNLVKHVITTLYPW